MTIRDRVKELRRIPAKTLLPNPKNWRQHPQRQKDAMAAVLQEIGYADALLAREDSNGNLVLIDGHLRAGTTPETIVPVLILDVDEAEADKILATLDPLAGMAIADDDAFRSLVGTIEADFPEFQDLLLDLNPASARVEGEDNVPPLPADPVSRPGDLWLLGRHRVLCGDSTNATEVSRLFDGVEPLLMVTDPPYGVNYRPAWRNEAAKAGKIGFGARREGKVSNDDRVDWAEAYNLFPGAIAYVWHASLFGSQVQDSLERCTFELRSQIVWAKTRFAISRGHYHWQHETCFYAVRKGSSGHWNGDRSQTTLWHIDVLPEDAAKNHHSTQKPVECMRRPILNHTNPGQCVYDPFVGSGTTVVAADSSGRICYGMDIDPCYIDVVVKRWQDLTDQEATLESEGVSFNEIRNRRGVGDANA